MEDELVKKGAEVLSKPTQEFLEKVSGSPGLELGELIADKIRFRRYKAALKLSEKARELAQEKGIDPKEVPLRTLLPILEGGSNEEEPEMADRWARLLTEAAQNPHSVPPGYPAILAELSPTDAQVLDRIYRGASEAITANTESNWTVVNMRRVELADALDLTLDEFDLSTANLLRLQLLLPAAHRLDFLQDKENMFLIDGHDQLRISVLGRRFVEACGNP